MAIPTWFYARHIGQRFCALDEERLLTTPTRANKYLLRSTDMVIVDPEGRMADDQEYKFQLMQTGQITYPRFG
jgi:ribulose-5-phosphate 4-epimerase/fuculose-1-phosphate aldolase